MFTSLLERNIWIIVKIGMPLVFLYHAVLGNIFLNTAAEDAKGLERIANLLLVPAQYVFEGKKATPHVSVTGKISYVLENRFSYKKSFFLKSAAATTLLPVSLIGGSIIKGVAYLSSETKDRAAKIVESAYSREVLLQNEYYTQVGIEVADWRDAEVITEKKYNKRPGKHAKLEGDLEALKDISAILSSQGVMFWLDCGSCLGAYQYEGLIPHDWDIDLGILATDFDNVKNALHALDPQRFVVQDWSARNLPKSYLKVYVKETGNLIDIFVFAIDPEKKLVTAIFSGDESIFMPQDWKLRERGDKIPCAFADLFPLKKGMFEGIEVPVPRNIKNYLTRVYGENLAPAKVYNEISQTYERDLTHPYWQNPHAH